MSRPLLLDTCACMYQVANDPIAEAANDAINRAVDAKQPLFVSPITAWEVGMLSRKGRFRSPLSPQSWLERLRGLPGIRFCELSADVALASHFLPGTLNTNDPADRILAATAREHGYTVMTRDRALLEYGAGGHLAVLEC